MKEIDCRGLPCPQPVLRTKQALEELAEGTLLVMVDNEAAKGNVTRFAESRGHAVSVREREGEFHLTIEKKAGGGVSGAAPADVLTCRPGEGGRKKNTVIVFRSDRMGVGDDALGKILVQALLKTLPDMDERPGKLIFYNRGVHLTAEGSEVISALQHLAGLGMEILVCGTCLDYYHLKEKLAVGTVSNMFTILDSMLKADSVIFP